MNKKQLIKNKRKKLLIWKKNYSKLAKIFKKRKIICKKIINNYNKI